ncbi:unnamed protein product, partial [Mesorhabditis spiculigera]
MLEIAVRHQLRRPVLARMLDIEEARLPIQEDVNQAGTAISNILCNLLKDTSLAPVTNNQLCEDLLAIIKGMVDAAGLRGEHDAQCLLRRVEYAVYGYIDRCPDTPPEASPVGASRLDQKGVSPGYGTSNQ